VSLLDECGIDTSSVEMTKTVRVEVASLRGLLGETLRLRE
jgi:hypothetical protein